MKLVFFKPTKKIRIKSLQPSMVTGISLSKKKAFGF
jgi:hypothetical protein